MAVEPSEPLEIALIGFGAVGVILSLILESKGLARVSAVARSNYAAIREKGIRIESQLNGTHEAYKPSAVYATPEEAAKSGKKFDYVLVTTKALPDVKNTAEITRPFWEGKSAEELPVFVLIQNGIGVEKDLAAAAPQAPIISSTIYIATNMLNGEVRHSLVQRLVLGPLCTSPSTAAAAQRLVDVLVAGGADAKVTDDITLARWSKNIWNATVATLSTSLRLSPTTYLVGAHAQHTIPLLRALSLEYWNVARALGVNLSKEDATNNVDFMVSTSEKRARGEIKEHLPSMLLDRLEGRALELEVILGEVVREAKRLGVETPRLDTIYAELSVIHARILEGKDDGKSV